ncbi:MAG: polysaccharide deacetylase family protein [Bacillota bacterium]
MGNFRSYKVFAALLLFAAGTLFLAGCNSRSNIQSDGSSPRDSLKTPLPPVLEIGSRQPVNQPSNKKAPAEKEETTAERIPRPSLGLPSAEAKTPDGEGKVAYLTFDDGPNTDFTGRVLDILAEKNVKATFFVLGRNVALNPDILQRIIDEGHGIGNHTYSHDYKIIYKSPENFIADLEKNNQLLEPHTGKQVKVIRAPGGPAKLGSKYRELLSQKGYVSVGWNITTADSSPKGVTPEQELKTFAGDLERVERLKLSPIILMHDGTQLTTTQAKPGTPLAFYVQNRESTIKALPQIIDILKEKGYTFKIADENTPPAW